MYFKKTDLHLLYRSRNEIITHPLKRCNTYIPHFHRSEILYDEILLSNPVFWIKKVPDEVSTYNNFD